MVLQVNIEGMRSWSYVVDKETGGGYSLWDTQMEIVSKVQLMAGAADEYDMAIAAQELMNGQV